MHICSPLKRNVQTLHAMVNSDGRSWQEENKSAKGATEYLTLIEVLE